MSFELIAHRALPGGARVGDRWVVRWQEAAVMGIVNVTPDSFSDGGLHADPARAAAHARALVAAGALVVDIGGESTRPGATPVGVPVEIDRVRPVIRELAGAGCLLSVDTRHAEVAAAAIEAGAHLVNDVGGLRDAAMVDVCATTGTPAVIVHMQGTPETMQEEPTYVDVVGEVARHLTAAAARALDAGVPSVIVDPGIGFGKTTDHNVALLRSFPFDGPHPVMVGASRKRFIERIAGPAAPDRRDAGSIAAHLYAVQRGAAMVRAHDVAAHVQALAIDRGLRGLS